jgi:squalene synthase HpnC
LLDCFAGRPRHPIMVALRETVERFHIPPRPFLDLLFAFEQDQLIRRYQTYEQLLYYCRHSANPVGHLVLYLCEAYTASRAALADCICTALQLANFWQDVVRDYAIGRIYLPEEDRRRLGVSEADIARRRFTPAFAALLRFEVDRTRALFERGYPLVEQMPPDTRLDIELFVRGGRAVLGKIERCGYNVLRARPVLARWDKAALLTRALWGRLWSALL